MFKKVIISCFLLCLVNAAYRRPVAGGEPAALYPAGLDPSTCPNFPHCDAISLNQASLPLRTRESLQTLYQPRHTATPRVQIQPQVYPQPEFQYTPSLRQNQQYRDQQHNALARQSSSPQQYVQAQKYTIPNTDQQYIPQQQYVPQQYIAATTDQQRLPPQQYNLPQRNVQPQQYTTATTDQQYIPPQQYNLPQQYVQPQKYTTATTGQQFVPSQQYNLPQQYVQPQQHSQQSQPQNAAASKDQQYTPEQQRALDRGEYIGDGDYHEEGVDETVAPEYKGQQQSDRADVPAAQYRTPAHRKVFAFLAQSRKIGTSGSRK